MVTPAILVVSESLDVHADWVIVHLQKKGRDVLRLHPEDFADLGRYRFRIGQHPPAILTTPAGNLDPSQIRSVYYRRPQPPIPPPHLNQAEANFWVDEANEVVNGLLAAIPESARWVNRPSSIRRARNKLRQLMLATRVGLSVPQTLVTNDPDEAFAFFTAVEQRAVCKALSFARVADDAMQAFVYTHRIPPDANVEYFESIRFGSSIIQEEIHPREADVRVTIVGHQVFACDLQVEDQTPVDWRVSDPEEMQWSELQIPDEVRCRLLNLQDLQDLASSEVDLIRDAQGNYSFLEMNPNGQWLFVERATGQPIGAAFADLLSAN